MGKYKVLRRKPGEEWKDLKRFKATRDLAIDIYEGIPGKGDQYDYQLVQYKNGKGTVLSFN